jgi:hypothetical protein
MFFEMFVTKWIMNLLRAFSLVLNVKPHICTFKRIDFFKVLKLLFQLERMYGIVGWRLINNS